MVSLWLLLQPALVLSACYRWECASLEDAECFSTSPNSLRIQVQACPSGTKCAINQMSSVQPYDMSKSRYDCVALSWLPAKKVPGELCELGENCYGGLCSGGVCKGKMEGMQCLVHEECNAGLICSKGICVPQAPQGAQCASDEECANDSLCYNGKCTLVMSLPDGSEFSGWISENANLICSSGYISNKKCSPAPKNINAPDFTCLSDWDCGLIHPDSSTGTGRCFCGFNSYGRSYCQAQAGDSEFEPFQQGLLSILKETNKCHFSISISSRCPALATHPDYASFINAYYLFYYRHAVISTADCVQNLFPFAQGYEYAMEQTGGSSEERDKVVVIVVVVVVFSVVLAAGIVCCMCLRKCAIDERNQEVARRQIIREEMEEIPIRISRIVHSALNESSQPSPRTESSFQITDIVLNPRNKHYLLKGIPVGKRVNPTSFELEEGVEEWETVEVMGIEDLQAGDEIRAASRSEKNPASSNVSSTAL